jgi:hypothetical protein
MGGDLAPEALLSGAHMACDPLGGLRMAPERIVLVGKQEVIDPWLAEHPKPRRGD